MKKAKKKKVHFTEDVYVVFKRPGSNFNALNSICEEVKRGLDYPSAIGLAHKLNFSDETLPKDKLGWNIHLYCYLTEDQFDEYQDEVRKELREGQQLTFYQEKGR